MIELAAGFAPHVRPGEIVALLGGLGSGKTTFVRGLARALMGSDSVTSPTFTLWHRYPDAAGKIGLEHLDLYRINDEAELTELGLEEAFGPDVVTVVEWPERATSLVPHPDWRVCISGSGDEPRQVSIERRG
jgi:tRNA threonylcarbamoyladenosine biosynthesis protein TsaE